MRDSFFHRSSRRTPTSKPGALSQLRLRKRSSSDCSEAHGGRQTETLAVTNKRVLALESLRQLVDVVDSVHRRPNQAVGVVDFRAAVVQEADVAPDECK
jgi:hypothetical protein